MIGDTSTSVARARGAGQHRESSGAAGTATPPQRPPRGARAARRSWPRSASSSTCVPISEARIASSLSCTSAGWVFSHGDGEPRVPVVGLGSRRPPRRAAGTACGRSGRPSRRRRRRPARPPRRPGCQRRSAPSSAAFRRVRTPRRTPTAAPRTRRPRPSSARDRSSTASSSTGSVRPSPTRRSTARCCSCRNPGAGSPTRPPSLPRSTRHWADRRVSSPMPRVGGPRRAEHAELPAGLVLRRARAVRVEQVALVEHRVGDRAGLVRVFMSRLRRRAARAASARSRPTWSGRAGT